VLLTLVAGLRNPLKIRTPTGTRITLRQYIGRSVRAAEACIYDHTGCAAWRQGPCIVEVAAMLRRATVKTGKLARPNKVAAPSE
jgi:hypothetical protein